MASAGGSIQKQPLLLLIKPSFCTLYSFSSIQKQPLLLLIHQPFISTVGKLWIQKQPLLLLIIIITPIK